MVLPGDRNKVKLPDSKFSALVRSVAVGGLLSRLTKTSKPSPKR